MYLIIPVLIIFIRQINNNFYVSTSLRKLQITIPGSCVYWIHYIRFSAPQITAFSRKEIGILCVYRNESLYVDNPGNGWKLVLPKH